jgi:hypothetical protein
MSDNCREFRSRIADFVTGMLPEPDRRELQEHLSDCDSCRDYMQALQREDAQLTKYFAGIDEDMAHRQERALQRIECSDANRRSTISLWRRIMNSPFSKLATAAAIVVATALTIVVLDQSTSRAYAISDVSAAFDQAQVIHVQGWRHFPRFKMKDGTERPPIAIESWIDLENGRMRQTQVAISQRAVGSSHGVPGVNTTIGVTEVVCDGPYLMTLDHTAKTATFAQLSEYGRQLMAYRQSRLLWGQLCSQPAQLEQFTKTGREEIDGVPCDIWQLDSVAGMGSFASGGGVSAGGGSRGGGSFVQRTVVSGSQIIPSQSKLWISTAGGRLTRAQVLSQTGNGQWTVEQDYSKIDYDVTIPEDVFATELPDGYTATNPKETAPVMEPQGAMARCANLECQVPASFTLGDGSVIVGWQSLDRDSDESQGSLFANMTFGGSLPKLPIEIFGIRPAGSSDRMAYTARHLAYTSKAGRFTEWALYVPKATPPAGVKYQGYDAISRLNTATSLNGAVGMNIGYGVPVDSAEDFEKWVRGAMAEFSDAGAPADVPYEKVSNLAQQVRTTGKP